uniref:Uncharacterized protein n=1 Tax=Tetradesmus obliquus TaxID=3088 RepID=A0A383W104_TETOB|eukprot:jgi/Sobl393_1/15126/SZX70346.1
MVLAATATSCQAQQQQQPNTTLNEFKNASAAAAVVDPNNTPALCTLKPADLAAADLAAVRADCDSTTLEGPEPNAGLQFCKSCGCSLNLLAYRSLNRTGAFKSASTADDNDVQLDVCGHWVLQQALQQGQLSPLAVTALDACQPIDFICDKASKRLDSSLITKAVTDRFAVLGGSIQDAIEETQAGEMPGLGSAAAAAAAPAAAKSGAAVAAADAARMVMAAAVGLGVLLQLLQC